jgi:predicted amidohydrolase
MDLLCVAAVQFPLSDGVSEKEFLGKVESYIEEAQRGGAQLVVFPELITTEIADRKTQITSEKLQFQKLGEDFAPRYIQWLKSQAQSRKISILGGTTPRAVLGQILNTAILALADGRVALQDKLFLTPEEKGWGWTPGSELKIFMTPWGRVAITICFDCEFPMVSNLLLQQPPDILLVPSWTSTEWGLNRVDWTAKSRAVEHYAFVVKTGTVPGPNSEQDHYGRAAILSPQDVGFPAHAIEGPLNEASIVFARLDLQLQKEKKLVSEYYPGKEQGQRSTPIQLLAKSGLYEGES